MKTRTRELLTFSAGILLCLALIEPAVAADANGYWRGAIKLPGSILEVSLTITSGDDGWSALLDIPAQGVRRMELDKVAVVGNSVTCHMPGVPGDPTFNGTLADDGSSFNGDFLQGGQSFKFSLAKAEPPADADVDIYADFVKPGVPGEGLAGSWNGLLRGGPMKLRMRLEFTSGEGGLAGSLISVDQGGGEFTLSSITLGEGNVVKFEASVVGGRYVGILSADGAELDGRWTQQEQTIQLAFHRTGS